MADAVKQVTGESGKGLLVAAAGAVIGGAFIVPMVQRFTGLAAPIAGLLGGAAIAMLASGNIKKFGQGLAFASTLSLAGSLVAGAGILGGAGGGRSVDSLGVPA